jgi:hypothetical protein
MAALAANVTDNATGVLAPYGLLSPAVKVIEDNDPHWQNGFQYETLGCAGTTTLHSICASASADIVEASGETWRSYRPFEVQTTFSCSTMSRTPDELETLARAELDIVIQKAIEREFLTGALATAEATETSEDANRFLSDDEAVSLTAVDETVKIRQGIALLEDAIASAGNGAQGVIHVPRSVGSVGTLDAEGETLYTGLDTPVVAGVGYSPIPGETDVVLYGTGPVTVRLGSVIVVPDEMSQAIDRANNTTTYKATRVAAVTWDSCVHFSVTVDLALDY